MQGSSGDNPGTLEKRIHWRFFFNHIQLIRRRLFPFLLIVLAHLVLLQLLSQVQFVQINTPDVVSVSIFPDSPSVVTKFAPPPPIKIPPAPKKAALVASTAPKVTATSSSNSAAASHAEPVLATPVTTPEPAPEALRILPPPSANYLLDVVRTEPKLSNPYRGVGEIRWQHDGQHYSMQIEAGINVLFTTVRLYSLQSEGTIEAMGIKPHSVTETRRGKTTTHTQFDYDSNTIRFSLTDAQVPLEPGAQDRATVFMQLASIGNADPTQFQADKQITLQVAEDKEAHLHQFVVMDQETIETPLGRLNTWHIVRPARPGVYSSQIDIWLAPDLYWLPVQIRNSETNGAVTTQTIRQILTGSGS